MSIIKLARPPEGADECWALDRYSALRPLMYSAKYRGHKGTTMVMCDALWSEVDDCVPRRSLLCEVDTVVAVPSRWRLSQRTSGVLATRLGVPWRFRALTWVGAPPAPLKRLPPADRPAAVLGSMAAASPTTDTVLVVDDSVHSTATLAEASRALRAAGANRIVCVALARI